MKVWGGQVSRDGLIQGLPTQGPYFQQHNLYLQPHKEYSQQLILYLQPDKGIFPSTQGGLATIKGTFLPQGVFPTAQVAEISGKWKL